MGVPLTSQVDFIQVSPPPPLRAPFLLPHSLAHAHRPCGRPHGDIAWPARSCSRLSSAQSAPRHASTASAAVSAAVAIVSILGRSGRRCVRHGGSLARTAADLNASPEPPTHFRSILCCGPRWPPNHIRRHSSSTVDHGNTVRRGGGRGGGGGGAPLPPPGL